MTVKRTYSSDFRAQQAGETRRLVVSAAARLFIEVGYGATTIDAIAEAAGVSRKTVFNAVGGKLRLLETAMDWATVGDDEPVPLLDRPEVESIARQSDPPTILRQWAALTTAISSRLADLSRVLAVAADIDPQARILRQTAQAQRYRGAAAFVGHLAALGVLAPDLDTGAAADIVWLYSDPQLFGRLVRDRHWPVPQFEDWLYRTMTGQLLTV
jgi:AcrR family transcriptional regulator